LIFVADWGGIVNETAEKCKNSTQNVALFAVWLILYVIFAVAAYRNVSEIGKYPKTFIPSPEDVKCRQRGKGGNNEIQRGIKEILLSDNPDNVYYELEKIRELDNQVLENFEIIKSNSAVMKK